MKEVDHGPNQTLLRHNEHEYQNTKDLLLNFKQNVDNRTKNKKSSCKEQNIMLALSIHLDTFKIPAFYAVVAF